MAPQFFYFAHFSWCNLLTGALSWLKVFLSGGSFGTRYKESFEKLQGQESQELRAGIDQARVVQRLDNAIHRINHYPADSVVGFVNTYPLDSDLSSG